jgi:hypothetical protein
MAQTQQALLIEDIVAPVPKFLQRDVVKHIFCHNCHLPRILEHAPKEKNIEDKPTPHPCFYSLRVQC